MWDRVIQSVLVSLIMTGVPAIYEICKKNKEKKESEGKIYYGVFRIILLYAGAIISGEMLLMLMFGTDTIEGVEALILTLICSIPFMYIYLLIYKHYQKKKLS